MDFCPAGKPGCLHPQPLADAAGLSPNRSNATSELNQQLGKMIAAKISVEAWGRNRLVI